MGLVIPTNIDIACKCRLKYMENTSKVYKEVQNIVINTRVLVELV